MEDLERSLTAWNWVNVRSLELARTLVITVDQAERFERRMGDELPDTYDQAEALRLARGLWKQACELAEELRRIEPGGLPTSVYDAIERTDAASDIHGLTAAPDHAAGG